MKKLYILFLMLFVIGLSSNAQIGKCKGKYLGNITAGTVWSNYTANWNQMTMENESKWQSVEGTRGSYNFTGSDRGFNWAKNNNGIFKYHTLMWGAQTPGWVASATSATIQAAIEPYFKAVADHYNPMGGLKMIDVLNEPINTAVATNLKSALTALYKAQPANSGDQNNQYGWAIVCFQIARKYFPTATLLINEYNIEMNWNNCRTPYIAMANAIKNAPNLTDGKKNLIDGVGLQAHGIENLTAANFKACIDQIWNQTGLPIHITEFDATADPNEAKQQQVYSTLIPVAWEHPHVAGITLWGYIQGSTWIGGNKVTGAGGTDSGIMYASGGDRPAMTWLRSYFAGKPSLACCPAPGPFADCANGSLPVVSITAPTANAAFIAPASITINATATDADGTISKVEFYNGTTKLGEDASSPYSYTWTNVALGSYTLTAVATDNAANKTTSAAVAVKVNVAQGAYNGTVHAIPGKIEFEHYDVGGNGSAYMDSEATNTGGATFRTDEDVDLETCTDAGAGYNLGWTTAGEWLEYTVNVANAGKYNLVIRAACNGDGRTVDIQANGVTVAPNVAIPNTTGWQIWQDVTVKDVTLSAGPQVIRVIIGATDYVNLNYMTFASSSTPPTVSITAPAANAEFTANQKITITATAASATGTIASVKFYAGTTLLNTDAICSILTNGRVWLQVLIV
ncbi:MAG: endo-1,4-beta-xylanase [Bacteroidales bacterium]|nr:endo-1,4-beta-xylanase [Bacteroidales bacterium]